MRSQERYLDEDFGEAFRHEATMAEYERELVVDECEQGVRFNGVFEANEGVYDPTALDLRYEEDNWSFGYWLMQKFGRWNAARTVAATYMEGGK